MPTSSQLQAHGLRPVSLLQTPCRVLHSPHSCWCFLVHFWENTPFTTQWLGVQDTHLLEDLKIGSHSLQLLAPQAVTAYTPSLTPIAGNNFHWAQNLYHPSYTHTAMTSPTTDTKKATHSVSWQFHSHTHRSHKWLLLSHTPPPHTCHMLQQLARQARDACSPT